VLTVRGDYRRYRANALAAAHEREATAWAPLLARLAH